MTNDRRKGAIVVEKNSQSIAASRDFMDVVERGWNHADLRKALKPQDRSGIVILSEAKNLGLVLSIKAR
jgi:hypothetical protein